MKKLVLGTALLTSLVTLGANAENAKPELAATSSLDNAVMGCYVDTTKYDYRQPNRCSGNSNVDDPSIVFSIMGINEAADRSRYTVDYHGYCTSIFFTTNEGTACIIDIDRSGSYQMTATVTDNHTGRSKTVSATAIAFINEGGPWM